jgi:hypothetical protein
MQLSFPHFSDLYNCLASHYLLSVCTYTRWSFAMWLSATLHLSRKNHLSGFQITTLQAPLNIVISPHDKHLAPVWPEQSVKCAVRQQQHGVNCHAEQRSWIAGYWSGYRHSTYLVTCRHTYCYVYCTDILQSYSNSLTSLFYPASIVRHFPSARIS